MVKTFRVLLFINAALVFTKIISTLYTGLYISFLFSHINITHPKVAPLPEVKVNGEEKQTGTKLIKGSWSSTWFFKQNKVSMKSVRGLKSFQKRLKTQEIIGGSGGKGTSQQILPSPNGPVSRHNLMTTVMV